MTRGRKPRPPAERLPSAPPDELMRMLIPPMQALELTIEGTAAQALANATRKIEAMKRDGLGHLGCSDILTALAELDLRGRQIAPDMIHRVTATHRAIEEARAALAAAEENHARAKAEIFLALGYREQAEAMGFRVGIVEQSTAP